MIERVQPLLAKRHASNIIVKLKNLTKPVTIVETDFDKKWRELTEHQQDQVRLEYEPLNAKDWRDLTIDQKRACTFLFAFQH